jgi:hypothetical protein
MQRREYISPHADNDLLKSFIGRDGTSVNPWSAVGMLSAAQFRDLRRNRDELASTIVAQVELMHSQYEMDDVYRRAVDQPTRGSAIQRGTRFIFRELLALITRHSRAFTKNDASDLLHAVVPSAYCDFVLLDGHWETMINQAKSRLERNGMAFPMAAVFSAKRGGVDRFVSELSKWGT